MSFEVNGQKFDSQEDYEKNYVVQKMDDKSVFGEDEVDVKKKELIKKYSSGNVLSGKQLRWAIEGAVRAALLVYGTVAAVALLFVAFCVLVWFK